MIGTQFWVGMYKNLSLSALTWIGHLTEPENSVALVRKRTLPTERPPLVGEVRANFCG
jgi:hypothetical protein